MCVYIEMIIIIIIIISHVGQDTEVEVRRKNTFPLIRIGDSCEPIDSILKWSWIGRLIIQIIPMHMHIRYKRNIY